MSNRSKAKGSRIEREIVELHIELGHKAERVPLSGSLGGKYSGDVMLDIGVQLRGEVKARANGEGFATLERWLGEHDVLFLRRDHAKPVVTMPWRTYEMLLKAVKALLAKSTSVEIASVLCLPPKPEAPRRAAKPALPRVKRPAKASA